MKACPTVQSWAFYSRMASLNVGEQMSAFSASLLLLVRLLSQWLLPAIAIVRGGSTRPKPVTPIRHLERQLMPKPVVGVCLSI